MDAEAYRRHVYQQAFGLNTMMQALQGHTFGTFFVYLSLPEARAIQQHFTPYFRDTSSEEALAKVQADPHLSNLALRIEHAMKALPCTSAFMKLNTRSPKDVFFLDKSPAHKRSVLEAVQKILSARDPTQGPLKDWEVYQAFVRACMLVSRVESGEQVSVCVCVCRCA